VVRARPGLLPLTAHPGASVEPKLLSINVTTSDEAADNMRMFEPATYSVSGITATYHLEGAMSLTGQQAEFTSPNATVPPANPTPPGPPIVTTASGHGSRFTAGPTAGVATIVIDHVILDKVEMLGGPWGDASTKIQLTPQASATNLRDFTIL
jgi:hypothetical protein